MAFTCGSVTNCKVANGQTRSEYECRLGYEVQSQSIANNTSSVKLRLQVRSISSTYKTYGYDQTTKIDGTSLAAKEFDMRSTNTWQTFGERTITVTHNTEGKYSASKSGSFTTTASSGYSLKSGSASVTVAPATIPRYATSNQSLSSKTENSINMNWSSDSTCDYIWYSTNNGGSWTGIDIADGTSGSYSITGLSPNTTYNIKTRVRRKDSQLTTDSSTLSVTTYKMCQQSLNSKTETSITMNWSADSTIDYLWYQINNGSWVGVDVPDGTSGTYTITGLNYATTYSIKTSCRRKATQTDVPTSALSVTTYDIPYCTKTVDFTIGNDFTLEFYNPLGRTFEVRFVADNGEKISYDLISGTTLSGWTGQSMIDRFYASIPNSLSGKYKIYTNWNGYEWTTNQNKTYSVRGIEKPTFNNFTYEDTNATTKALTGNNQTLINGYSNLKVTISTANKAYSNYGSEIDRYRLNVGNMSSVEKSYSSSAAIEMTINKVNSPSITVTAIDKRGMSQPVLQTATFKEYKKPIINSLVATRENGGIGSQVTLSFNGTWWNNNFGSVANSIKEVVYYYKRTIDSTWTKGNIQIIPTISGNNFSGDIKIEGPNADDKGFDVSTAYNIKMLVKDTLDTSSEYQTILGSGTPALAVFGSGVAVNQMFDEDNYDAKLQVNGETLATEPVRIKHSTVNPFVGIEKQRIIDGQLFFATFGLGQDKTASLEILDANKNLLGRMGVTTEGKIKNFMSNTIVVEKKNIFSGSLKGAETITLSNVKRFLDIYFTVNFSANTEGWRFNYKIHNRHEGYNCK